MTRVLSASLGWLFAAVIATFVAWQGVAVVGSQITSSRAPVIDQTQIVALATQADVPGGDVVPDSSAPSTSDQEPLPEADPAATTSPATTSVVDPDSGTAGTAETTSGAIAVGPTTTRPVPDNVGSVPTTTVQSPQGELQVFSMEGGRVYVWFSAGFAELRTAVPNDGFTVDDDSGSGRVDIEFRSASHRSKFEAWWAEGPHHRTSEEDRDSDDRDSDDRDSDERDSDDRDSDDRDADDGD